MRHLGLPAARPAPLPMPDAFASHQGRSAKRRNSTGQRALLGGLIARADLQNAPSGRPFAMPMFVVTISADTPVKRMAALAEDVLSGPERDRVVHVETAEHLDDERRDTIAKPRSPVTGHGCLHPAHGRWTSSRHRHQGSNINPSTT